MTKKQDLVPSPIDTPDILKISFSGLLEALTGIAASEKKDLILSVGHIFQGCRKGQFLNQLINELNRYRDKGRIKDDYLNTEQHYTCLQEMYDFLDNDSPDKIRFDAMKKVFLVAASEKISDRESLLPHQYMKICRTLSSGEVIVLSTSYELLKIKQRQHIEASVWLQDIADESGLIHPELVEMHEGELMKKNLLLPRIHSDKSGIRTGPHYRLTSLGNELCKYIENYEEP